MSDREQYTPGPAHRAQVKKDGEKWTLVLVRELRHSPERVRRALSRVTRADAPKVLEYSETRRELEAFAGGTRLRLWHNIDRRFITWGAAGRHIAFDVLDRLLAGQPIGCIVGADAMKFAGWQRLNAEYARLFLMKTPSWSPPAAQES